ncbi:hypothetical protein D7X33_34875, partial [Butyricicoccus sp. 1XD8-22]
NKFENLQFFKDYVEGRRDSEVVLISTENLRWFIDTIDSLKKYNKSLLKDVIELKKEVIGGMFNENDSR